MPELAALPAAQALHWAATVRDAMSDAERLCLQAFWGGPGASEALNIAAERTRLLALRTIAMWANEPVPVDVIEAMSKADTLEGLHSSSP
jgi:hypothetical protein